ncbi:GGDEF domain-containing protein [Pseudodesulfovibrio piezophilus]|uniref:diguanylate cyclase n=1 Tax=Pseudodesulfovibrio piezophilus (strain DSM 21447 / JCM 15486 / C1TLV30) TaxID=1322246 RepID=M1WLF5_PSEP2|nr:GGDEF domain-containing protein [Pseudodesulfovibrio piezophilus]CCH47775.1 Diguanylate cyclase [Pseudodesulfovibrio piezophilus C1TLV30]
MHTENHNQFPEDELATELAALQDELGEKLVPNLYEKPAEAIWIFRLFQGISTEEWQELAVKHDFSQWLTLPINGDAFPCLKQFQTTLEKLAYQTDHDALTGLANRRAFNRTFDIEMERSKRSKTPLSLAIFDLDNFKSINDTYGHPKGDEVLVTFSKMLQESTRRYDLAARYGGEEFALIMAGSGIVKAQRLLTRLLQEFKKIQFTPSGGGPQFNVTCSVGLTCYKGAMDILPEEILKLADEALYFAKTSGKDQVKVSKLDFVDNVPNDTLVQANEKQFLFGGK